MTTQELFTWPELFTRPEQCVDMHRTFGREYLESTVTYNDLWRAFGIERQILSTLRYGRQPLAFVCVTRSAKERAFTEEEIGQFDQLRASAEQAVLCLRRTSADAQALQAILDALETGLPTPAALFRCTGELLWLNEEMALRLWGASAQLGSTLLLVPKQGPIDRLRELARKVANHPETSITEPLSHCESRRARSDLVEPGERVVARRLQSETGAATMVLIAVAAPPPDVTKTPESRAEHARGLTAREADVARLAAAGHTIMNIAAILNISPNTVHTHLKRVYRKLDVHNRVELACKMFRAAGNRRR
jgi:DNA-binding CsgD family transcriptional regulator